MKNYSEIAVHGIEFSHKSDLTATAGLNTRHCHDTFELLFVVEGRGRYVVEGSDYPLRPRTLALIRPFEYHCVEIEPDCPYDRFVIHFAQDALPQEVTERFSLFLSEPEGSGVFYPPELLPESAISVFDRLDHTAQLPESERELYCRLLLSELLLFLSLSSSQQIIHGEGQLAARVLQYINDYLDSDISLDRLAKRFFVSKYYLCRTFKKFSGTSVHNYITQKRVMYAKQLIDSGETASGAAYRVGFGDYSAFYRAYVKVIGKPPTATAGERAKKTEEKTV